MSTVVSTGLKAQVLGQMSLSQSSYAIDKLGRLYAWGLNKDGQLGIGSNTDQNVPVRVQQPSQVSVWVLVAGGARHAIAVGDSDRLYAWGYNGDGELGNGTVTDQTTPYPVQNPSGVTAWRAVSAGADHSIALASNGMLYAWGANTNGQLGSGDHVGYRTPHLVPLPSGVAGWSAVAAGAGYTIAIATNGTLYGWGADSSGSFPVSASPIILSSRKFRTASPLPNVAASSKSDAEIDASGQFIYNNSTLTGSHSAGVALGGGHAAYLTTAGQLYTVGANTYGQLGVGDQTTHLSPQLVGMPSGVTQWVAVAAGLHHTIALGNDGMIYAWGENRFGSVGDATNLNQTRPVAVSALGDPLRTAAAFTAPSAYSGVMFPVTITVQNVANGRSLVGGDAYLTLSTPLRYVGSSPDQLVFPQFMFPGDHAQATWNLASDSLPSTPDSIEYFAYVREGGSSPLLVSQRIYVPAKATSHVVTGRVIDSVTKAPIAFARVLVVRANGTMSDSVLTSSTGTYTLSNATALGYYTVTVVRENYSSRSVLFDFSTAIPDTVPTIVLGPAPILGSFATRGAIAAGTISRLFFVDSVRGFALSGANIYRTMDSGMTWAQIFTASAKLNDLYFSSPRIGWAVGAQGTILHTTDGGNSWSGLPSQQVSLNAVTGANNYVVAVGDKGTIVTIDPKGALTSTSFDTTQLNAISALAVDTKGGISSMVAAGNGGAIYFVSGDVLSKMQAAGGEDLFAAQITENGRFWVAGANGAIYSFNGNSPGGLARGVTLRTQTVRSLYFLNSNIGFAVGDSGAVGGAAGSASFVTYDGGQTWAPLREIVGSASDINFFGVNGHAAVGGAVMNFTGAASPVSGLLYGRIARSEDSSALTNVQVNAGAQTVYSNEFGMYVMSGIRRTTAQTVTYTMFDSLGSHTATPLITTPPGALVRQDIYFSSSASVPRTFESRADVTVLPNPATNVIRFVGATASACEIEIHDVLGRVLRAKAFAAGEQLELSVRDLSQGTYYYTIRGANFSGSGSFVVTR